jgi:adenine deaminase
MTWDGIIGLGEMMNFPGVYFGDEKMHSEMAATRSAGKVIGGHYAAPDLGLPFHGYVAGGPEDDHEGTRMEDAAERVRQGMKAMLRFGSAWHDVAEGVRAITELHLDPHRFILCTDDSHSETLINEGHVDRAVREAITHGLPAMTAIQMTTLNTAEHFGLSRDMGMIAPGRFADVLLVDDLEHFQARVVFARGRRVAENGRLVIDRMDPLAPRRITYFPNEKKLLVEKQVFRTPGFLTRLHSRVGYGSRYKSPNLWAFGVDLSIFGTLLWVFSGFWLWWELKVTRRWGTAFAVAGVALFGAFVVFA